MGWIWLSLAWLAPAHAQTLSNSQVLAIINADRKAEDRVEEAQIRVVRPAEFPDVTLVGFLTGNRGCILGTVLIGSHPYHPGVAAATVLAQLGWQKADEAERMRLARLWIDKAVLAFNEKILEAPTPDFGDANPRFEPPTVTPTAAGGVRILAWIQEDAGTGVANCYRKSFYLFSPEGQLKARMLERFDGR